MNNFILSTSALIGTDVKNIQGENLGTIKDLSIDIQSGRVAYLVLAFGGFLGFGDKYFAIPLQSFSVDPQDDRLILNVEKEKLENAPGFDKNHIPDSPQKDFIDEVYSHYGYGSFLKEKILEHENRFVSVDQEHSENRFRSQSEDINTRNRDFDPDNNKSLF
ncbi:MAG TPA: PRC-barrel domain-containing protein [Cytophagales bacterium]|nr:PRC-barrel domain-containing protein [Cytophagales bacterium]